MADSKLGMNCKVALGSNTILGMGDWSIDGFSREEIDDTAFGDEEKRFEFGVIDGGTISFSGFYKPSDTDGQVELEEAFDQKTDLTSMRLYIDLTSYYEPCQTTSYLSPTNTSAGNTKLSHVNIISRPINAEKGGLMQTSFQARVTGRMVLV